MKIHLTLIPHTPPCTNNRTIKTYIVYEVCLYIIPGKSVHILPAFVCKINLSEKLQVNNQGTLRENKTQTPTQYKYTHTQEINK